MKLPREFILYAALLAIVAVLPLLGAYPVFVMKVMCYALFACAFNLLIGFTGLLSFGHAAFLGGAAYAAGHALKVWGVPMEIGLLIGIVAGAVLGLVMGMLAIRRSGIYFSMITLALAQMLYFVFLQAGFTGGEDGLQSVPRGKLLGMVDLQSDITLYYVVLAIFVLSFLLIYRTVHSPFGQVLKAIRENEARATSLGYDTARFKLLAFVLVGGAGRTRRCDQDTRTRFRYPDRRALEHIGTRDPDGAGRRNGNHARADPRRFHRRCTREQGRRHRHVPGPCDGNRMVQRAWRSGHGGDRTDLRRLRDGVPSRPYRRTQRLVAEPAIAEARGLVAVRGPTQVRYRAGCSRTGG